jgi:hypothetical protein
MERQQMPHTLRLARITATACAALALTGCMSFSTEVARNTQLGLTALMAVDTAQTVTIGRSACLREANPIAAAVFGTDMPSPQRVLVTNALYMGAHWLLGSFLDRKAHAPVDLSIDAVEDIARRERWQRLQKVYWVATGIGHGFAVASNTRKGIHPFSSFDCGGAQ